MTVLSSPPPRTHVELSSHTRRTTDGVPLLLRFTAFAIFVVPASMVIEPLGAAGTVPLLLACLLLALWLCSLLWRLHDPIPARHPGRLAAAAFLFAVVASYVAMHAGWTGSVAESGYSAADRWLILVAGSIGLILVTAEQVRSVPDALQLLRWVLAGAFFCTLVALVQFFAHVNPMEWVQSAMVGFTYNGGDTPFQVRGNLIRPAGTTFTSIEFAVVMGMLFPLSIWRALNDPRGWKWFHWLQSALLLFGIASTVSRSGTLALVVGLLVMFPFTSRAFRRTLMITAPVVLVLLFAAVPGMASTLFGALTADTTDPSIATRVNNYPRVARLIDLRPVFGVGPGNYVAENALQILDNQYLNATVSMGIVGLIGVAVYLLLPAITAVHTARNAASPELRSLAGAAAGALAVAGVCSITFDSLSFPVFALAYPLLVGLSGAIWRIVAEESAHALVLGNHRVTMERGT